MTETPVRDLRPMVSITKAARLVDVSRKTIYTWIRQGKVECVRIPTGHLRIFVDTLWRPGHPEVQP